MVDCDYSLIFYKYYIAQKREYNRNFKRTKREFLLKVASKRYQSQIIKTREILTHDYIDIASDIIYSITNEQIYPFNIDILRLQPNFKKYQ